MNNIILGDSLIEMQKFEDESIDSIITDPPYGIGFMYKEKEQANNHIDYWRWFEPFYKQMMRVLKKGGFYCIFQAYKYFPYYWDWYGKDIDIFISAKNFSTLFKTPINLGYDPAVIGFKDGSKPRLPENRKSRNFILCNTANNKQGVKIKSVGNNHPSPKPLDGMRYLVENFTNEDDLVLDPFAGSGQTLVACSQLNRRFIGIELQQEYYDFAKQRLNESPLLFPRNTDFLKKGET